MNIEKELREPEKGERERQAVKGRDRQWKTEKGSEGQRQAVKAHMISPDLA